MVQYVRIRQAPVPVVQSGHARCFRSRSSFGRTRRDSSTARGSHRLTDAHCPLILYVLSLAACACAAGACDMQSRHGAICGCWEACSRRMFGGTRQCCLAQLGRCSMHSLCIWLSWTDMETLATCGHMATDARSASALRLTLLRVLIPLLPSMDACNKIGNDRTSRIRVAPSVRWSTSVHTVLYA